MKKIICIAGLSVLLSVSAFADGGMELGKTCTNCIVNPNTQVETTKDTKTSESITDYFNETVKYFIEIAFQVTETVITSALRDLSFLKFGSAAFLTFNIANQFDENIAQKNLSASRVIFCILSNHKYEIFEFYNIVYHNCL